MESYLENFEVKVETKNSDVDQSLKEEIINKSTLNDDQELSNCCFIKSDAGRMDDPKLTLLAISEKSSDGENLSSFQLNESARKESTCGKQTKTQAPSNPTDESISSGFSNLEISKSTIANDLSTFNIDPELPYDSLNTALNHQDKFMSDVIMSKSPSKTEAPDQHEEEFNNSLNKKEVITNDPTSANISHRHDQPSSSQQPSTRQGESLKVAAGNPHELGATSEETCVVSPDFDVSGCVDLSCGSGAVKDDWSQSPESTIQTTDESPSVNGAPIRSTALSKSKPAPWKSISLPTEFATGLNNKQRNSVKYKVWSLVEQGSTLEQALNDLKPLYAQSQSNGSPSDSKDEPKLSEVSSKIIHKWALEQMTKLGDTPPEGASPNCKLPLSKLKRFLLRLPKRFRSQFICQTVFEGKDPEESMKALLTNVEEQGNNPVSPKDSGSSTCSSQAVPHRGLPEKGKKHQAAITPSKQSSGHKYPMKTFRRNTHLSNSDSISPLKPSHQRKAQSYQGQRGTYHSAAPSATHSSVQSDLGQLLLQLQCQIQAKMAQYNQVMSAGSPAEEVWNQNSLSWSYPTAPSLNNFNKIEPRSSSHTVRGSQSAHRGYSSAPDWHDTSQSRREVGYENSAYPKRLLQQSAIDSRSSGRQSSLFIVPSGYPNKYLSDRQMDAIENCILEAILEIEDDRIKPAFKESHRSNGRYKITCNDEFSAKWLKMFLSLCEPSLRVIQANEFRANAILPSCKGDNNDRILKFIAKQNQGLNVSEWEVLERWDNGDANTCMNLVVDEVSIQVLERCSKISFKLGSAHIYPMKGEKGSDQTLHSLVPFGSFGHSELKPRHDFPRDAVKVVAFSPRNEEGTFRQGEYSRPRHPKVGEFRQGSSKYTQGAEMYNNNSEYDEFLTYSQSRQSRGPNSEQNDHYRRGGETLKKAGPSSSRKSQNDGHYGNNLYSGGVPKSKPPSLLSRSSYPYNAYECASLYGSPGESKQRPRLKIAYSQDCQSGGQKGSIKSQPNSNSNGLPSKTYKNSQRSQQGPANSSHPVASVSMKPNQKPA